MKGNNVAGEGVILGAEYSEDPEAFIEEQAWRYRRTPTLMPNKIPRGRGAHVGGGLWFYRCPECDDYALVHGSLVFIYELASHTRTHGVDVVGINVGMLS